MSSTMMASSTRQSGSSGPKSVTISVGAIDSYSAGKPSQMATPECLTPMPEYMRPVVKSASSRWRKLHQDHMMAKLIEKRTVRKAKNQATKEQAVNIVRKIPVEVLAKEWLKTEEVTVETRTFLVDKILPTLILGLEKLLVEVEKNGLAEVTEPDPNFNPVNFLAQYLMRNNPRYSNFSEASPYIRGLRSVADELKQELFDMDENRLIRIKAEARRRREDRESLELMLQLERTRRADVIAKQFTEWTVGLYHDRIRLALIQNALKSYAEIFEQQYPDELKQSAKYSQDVEPTDDSGKTLTLVDFSQYLGQYIDELPSEVFDQFMDHMSRCAMTFRAKVEGEQRKDVLSQLFVACDNAKVGYLDRHRILNLFEMFFDKFSEKTAQSLRNPRKWPVVEVHEENISDDEDDGAEPQDPRFIDNNVDVTAEAKGTTTEDGKDAELPAAESMTDKDDADKTATDSMADIDGEDKPKELPTPEAEVQEEDKAGHDGSPDDAKIAQQREEDESAAKPAVTASDRQTNMTPKEEQKLEVVEEEEEGKQKGKVKDAETKAAVADMAVETESVAADGVTSGSAGEKRAVTIREDTDAELEGLVDRERTLPESSGERPPMTQQSKVSFAEGTAFQKDRTLMTSQGNRSQSQASAFDENTLNMSQFVQVTETFMGDIPQMEAFSLLVRYLKEGYMETEDERMERLLQAHREATKAKRKALLNSLFEMWDNDGSGFLDMDEVETVMKKYKEGLENEVIEAAKSAFRTPRRQHDNRLSKREFRELVQLVVDAMSGPDVFDLFLEFLLNSVERTYQERMRGEARKKLLQRVIAAAETGAASMEPVYNAVFHALKKDAEAHGGGKAISAYIAMLEKNVAHPARGDVILRYAASTPDDADLLLGRSLYKDMKGVSFASVESGKPIHVPRVLNHGNVHFWNAERDEQFRARLLDPGSYRKERDGSFLVVPLKDRRKRVFGLLGLDTLRDPHGRAVFITHEIQFFQGVAKAFSIAYHHVDVRQKTMRISESAVSWIQRRCGHVTEVVVYMMEPEPKGSDYLLRKMIATDHKGVASLVQNPPRLERKDNLFRDYLFKCVDDSKSVSADAYGERHLAFPLRDAEGRAIVVIDVSIGNQLKALPKAEGREVMKMLRLLNMAYSEISQPQRDGQADTVLEGDMADEDSAILFDRLMLRELRENVSRLGATAYAELKSYKEPPPVIHLILKAVLAVFYTEQALAGDFEDWNKCKHYVNPSLSQKILASDPTSDDNQHIPAELINSYLNDVPHHAVSKHGSMPAQFLYNWVFVCVSLVEHTRKMALSKMAGEVAAVGDGKPAGEGAAEGDQQREATAKTQKASEHEPRSMEEEQETA